MKRLGWFFLEIEAEDLVINDNFYAMHDWVRVELEGEPWIGDGK